MIQWLRSHVNAILVTAIAVAKAGVLGKSMLTVASAIAVAFGVTT
jgi:hypothetical protein